MKDLFLLICRTVTIALAFASIGLFTNLAADRPVPWLYAPPKDVELAGITVKLIDEREALKFLGDPRAKR